MTLAFFKMHALGNDFMIIDATRQAMDISALPVKVWANRHTGIGFDQLLLMLPSEKADIRFKIFNADGSQARQCGNGLRCIAWLAHLNGLAARHTMTVELDDGLMEADVSKGPEQVRVSLGIPQLQPGWIRLLPAARNPHAFALSVGNPHVILKVDDLRYFPLRETARLIAESDFFPGGINTGFMEVKDEHTLLLSTFERGTGETLSCGSNACAAAITGILHHGMLSPVTVEVQQGGLQVTWTGNGHPVLLEGPVTVAFEGKVSLPAQ